MKGVLEYLQGWSDLAICCRLIIATFLGSLIGWERISKRHNAGIRTFALVSLGAAVSTALNIKLGYIPGLEADVSRIPAGVISGIGFLGAGSILVTGRNQIKGLTTAASLWVCAAMGMVIGAGYLLVGTVCFALIIIANRVLQNLSVSVEEHSRYISIYLEVEKLKGVVKLRKYISETGYELVSMNKTKEKTLLDSDVALTVVLDMKSTTEHQNVLDAFNNLDYVNYLEEI